MFPVYRTSLTRASLSSNESKSRTQRWRIIDLAPKYTLKKYLLHDCLLSVCACISHITSSPRAVIVAPPEPCSAYSAMQGSAKKADQLHDS